MLKFKVTLVLIWTGPPCPDCQSGTILKKGSQKSQGTTFEQVQIVIQFVLVYSVLVIPITMYWV